MPAVPKPTGRTQKQRSRRRKRSWRDFQEWAFATLPEKCERCGISLTHGVQPPNLSHVKHRGMGGTNRAGVNDLENIRVLCFGEGQDCHNNYPGWDGPSKWPDRDKYLTLFDEWRRDDGD